MKVSQLKLGATYIGQNGEQRLLIERSFGKSLLLLQHDNDCVIYQKVIDNTVEEERHMITARAFARWAIQRSDS